MGEIVVNNDRKYLLVGLGGSGGKVITKLYKRLIRERGEGFKSNVACVAIDTDQDELNELAQLGVKKVSISGSGNVGQMFNLLGDDVSEWCPNTANEGNFFSSNVFNGASQCRLKSRLCLANFLKDRNNTLAQVLEEFLEVSPTNESANEAPPLVYIVSSIAGGTGSGIFIQTALYIKQFFRRYNLNAFVYGLFACPDLYKEVLNPQQLPSIYANAYAVIRELNAFNLICGNELTAAYGGKLELDIDISTDCEGKLFEKDSKGRYGDKPYDVLYFIDRVNSLSKILGGLDKYYEAMANIAYSHLYSDISGEVLSAESNEMNAHSIAPNAIYGSAGAATLRYPFEDIIRYFADRSISESFDSVWTEIDRKWANYVSSKEAEAKSAGRAKFSPTQEERAEFFIREFEANTKGASLKPTSLSFLAPMVNRNDMNAVDKLVDAIRIGAVQKVKQDSRIQLERTTCFGDIEKKHRRIESKIDNKKMGDSTSNIFKEIGEIDSKLAQYCRHGLVYVADSSIDFANEIFSDDKNIWDAYDKSEIGIIEGLLFKKGQGSGEWIHPVAARYLLYSLRTRIKDDMGKLLKNDTVADDVDDFYASLLPRVEDIKKKVGTNKEEEHASSNAALLEIRLNKPFGKASAKKSLGEYFDELKAGLKSIENRFVDALIFFAYTKVLERLDALINQYEFFFDNIEEFNKRARAAVTTNAIMHDNSKGTVYVCASAEVKDELYERVGKNIDMQTGEIASCIAESLFHTMREKSAALRNKKNKFNYRAEISGVGAYFDTVSDMVAENAMKNPEIQGAVQMNAFQAMLYEYALTNPEYAQDEISYGNDPAAKNRIDQFIAAKLSALTKLAAPFLMYDVEDPYAGMFKRKTEMGYYEEKPKVVNSYRFLSHNGEVDDSIRALVGSVDGEGGVVEQFYRDQASGLPKTKEGQTLHIDYVRSQAVDPYSILCYSTVHCLQPYQIKAFDEIKGGEYYKYYSQRIAEMQSVQRYSMTPHLDKRWHKHGVMPYINVAKEVDRRYDLAKAFLYALCYGKIGFKKDGSEAKLVFQDSKLDREMEYIFYKGRSIPANKVNRAMNWFADQEDLIERYAALFDQEVDAEVEKLSKYSDTVGGYKNGIYNYARILNQMKRNFFRDMDKKPNSKPAQSDDTKKKTTKEKEVNSILSFAWKLHLAEENELDKDYAELLLQTLCKVIEQYAKAPYNREDIENRDKGSDSYRNYLDVGSHITSAFLQDFAESVGKKLGLREETAEEADARRRKNSFGRDDSDLSDENDNLDVKAAKGANEEAILKNKSYDWVCAQLGKAFAE